MSTSSRSANARSSSSGPSKTGVLTSRRARAIGGSTSAKDNRRHASPFVTWQGRPGLSRPQLSAPIGLPAWRGVTTSTNPINGKERSPSAKPTGDEGKPAGFSSYVLSQVHLVESLRSGAEPPPAPQPGRTPRLARVSEARLDLFFENIAHVDLQRRLLAGEAPRFLGLVRLSRLGKREWIAGAGPRCIKSDAADDAVVGMVAIGNVGIERQQHVRPGRADLAHEFLMQLQVFDELSVRMAEECNALHAEHVRGCLLLALSGACHLRA